MALGGRFGLLCDGERTGSASRVEKDVHCETCLELLRDGVHSREPGEWELAYGFHLLMSHGVVLTLRKFLIT